MDDARLIALDWGSTHLRAWRLGPQGRVLDRRQAAAGVLAVPDGRFEAALLALCGDWLDDDERGRLPLIASGMIGSRQGWAEAPYLGCPAAPAAAAAALERVPLAGGRVLHIVPGLITTGPDGQADVMRGEETQLWGAGLAAGACCVLPGTHSKWAWMGERDAVDSFQTYMTGELFAVLSQHSILGRLMQAGPPRPDAFADGARLGLAEHAHLSHLIFAARTAGLTGEREGAALADFLSGLLIGAEVGSACARGAPAAVGLLGDDALVQRYAVALDLAGRRGLPLPAAEATSRGQWRVAATAGLVEEL
ncbi:MAG: 2-dehydro-3-deoxygalactonokinase [Rubrivivax sp.]